jgi:hypothetical protein
MTWDELKAEAFGEIGLLPDNFYELDHEDYFLLKKGYFNKRVYEQRVFRRMVMTIIAPWVKNMPSPYSILPLPMDDELMKEIKEYNNTEGARISEESMKVLRAFKEKEKNQKPKDN